MVAANFVLAKDNASAGADADATTQAEASTAATKDKPVLLYSLYYTQGGRTPAWTAAPRNFFAVPDQGGSVLNEDTVARARELFHSMFPGEEFLPATPRPEEALSVEAILAQESEGGAGFVPDHETA